MASYVSRTIDIEKNNKLIMTLKEWQESSYLSIENIIYNSSSDRTDKRGDDAMTDEPIGISHKCSPKMLYDIIIKKKITKVILYVVHLVIQRTKEDVKIVFLEEMCLKI